MKGHWQMPLFELFFETGRQANDSSDLYGRHGARGHQVDDPEV